jgi:uncharacterized delta-60 repeat protein
MLRATRLVKGRSSIIGSRRKDTRLPQRTAVVAESIERRILLSGLTSLASFNGTDASGPQASLLLSGGNLYGTASSGGDLTLNEGLGDGTIYSVPATGGIPTVLASFNGANGSGPFSDLILSGGNLYGTTNLGGSGGFGVVFSVPVGGGTPTDLASFDGTNGNSPTGGLLLSGTTLYGTSGGGGTDGVGEVFSVPLAGGTPTVLASFDNTDGGGPYAGLILSNNTLYGTAQFGGADGDGVVFSVPVTGGTPTVLASFDGADGNDPKCDLVLSNGILYGTTSLGGDLTVNSGSGGGTVFSLPVTGGTPTVLAAFNGADGSTPESGLAIVGNTLYGTTSAGGANGQGEVFSLPTSGGTPTPIVSFSGADGAVPYGALTIGAGGEIFGTTLEGGTFSGFGTVFAYSTAAPAAKVGGLDPNFGVGGIASANVGFTATSGLAIQPDGKSVIAGIIGSPGSEDFGLTRYNADGSLDTSFGDNGVASIDFQGTDDVPSSVVLLPNGQILEAGTSTAASGGSEFAVALFDANGTLDQTFGSGTGKVLTSFGSGSIDFADAVVLGKGGEFFVVGSSTAGGTGKDFAIAAYNADGTPAGSFNGSGHELLDFSGGDDSANGAVLQSNGELVVAGSTENPSTGVTSIALVRVLANGALDSHFGTKGRIVTNLRGVDDEATSVALQPKGQIVVGGESATGSFAGGLASDFAVLRYTSTGKLDRTFGRGGYVITSFGEDAAVTNVLVQSDGDIVASGKTASGFSSTSLGQLGIAVARYTTKGTLDPTFNGTGRTLITLNGPSATSSLQRPSAITPLDGEETLRQEFEMFLGSAQGIIATTPGGDLAVAGNSGGFTEEGQLIAMGIDLAASLLASLPASLRDGASVTLTIGVKEDGSSSTSGSATVQLFISDSSDTSSLGTQVYSKPQALKLKPLQSRNFKLKIKIPTSVTAGSYYLVAQVNISSMRDLNLLNNIAIKGPFEIT